MTVSPMRKKGANESRGRLCRGKGGFLIPNRGGEIVFPKKPKKKNL